MQRHCRRAREYLGTEERFVRRLVAQRRIAYVELGKYVRLDQRLLRRLDLLPAQMPFAVIGWR
ncbi:DNA-binding protein [Geodermatophilus sp. TF02-6]|nr:DNA-binding protein [Geodermatophilus sp. TF02-6]